jgi:uncharacterized protein YkwD
MSRSVSLGLVILVATNATMVVRAQQSPSTIPATGAAAAVRMPDPSPDVAAANSAAASAAPAARPAAVVSGDPYGFTAWLNSTRASYGLAPVGYDPNLSSWAAANNSQQATRGMGHYVMGTARRQNSAMGHYASIGAMWMASPAHRAALLDPSIRWIGIAGMGAYWTFNAN